MTTPTSRPNQNLRAALRPALPMLGAAVGSAVLAGLATLAATYCTVLMIGEASGQRALVVCGLFVVAALLGALASWLSHHAEAHFEARLRREVAAHMMRLPSTRLSDYPSDQLRRLVADEIAALHHMVAHLPGEIATMIVVPLGAVALLVALAGPTALAALVPGVLAAVLYLTVIPKLSAKHGAERGIVMGEITQAVDEYARGIHIYRSYGAGAGSLAEFERAAGRFTTGMVAWVKRVATPAAVAVALLQAAASYAIAYAVGFGRDTQTLAAMLLLSLALVTPALKLGHGLDYVASGRVAATRIAAFLAEPTLETGTEKAPELVAGASLRGVTVLAGERPLVEGLDATFAPGELTAVTGPSGAGKSTLLRVLAGVVTPAAGEATLGGVPVSELSDEARLATLSLVPQGLGVLPATVRENLLLARPGAGDEECREALFRAQLDPASGVGLDTNARELSGGQRQRVALARAFLADAPCLLVDEPTSALDRVTGEAVWAELERLAHERGKTVIAVTHDAALAARADAECRVQPATHEVARDESKGSAR